MVTAQKLRMPAFPSNPKHCPKCGGPLEESDEPEYHVIRGGNDCTIGGEIHYSCPVCKIEWEKHLIPDHYLYDPDCYWCPNCGSEEKRETEIIENQNGRTITNYCTNCGSTYHTREGRSNG